MKLIALLFILITVCQNVKSGDWSEYLTLWAPSTAVENEQYRVFFLPENLDKDTEIYLRFGTKSKGDTFHLIEGNFQEVVYNKKIPKFGRRNKKQFHITLFRNSTNGRGICSTKEFSIKADKRKYYHFIQLDKPIYKPGDIVKFRVLLLDRNLAPFTINNLEVTIIDPLNRKIQKYDDLENNNFGVFEHNFTLADDTVLGNWNLTVNHEFSSVSKIFPVQKFVLPMFSPQIDIFDRHLQMQSNLELTLYAKYSFGELVSGSCKLYIIDTRSNQTLYSDSFQISTTKKVRLNVANDLKLIYGDRVNLQALLVFTEPESDLTFNKTEIFHVFGDDKYKIKVHTLETFTPGQPFTVVTFLYDWKWNATSKRTEDVTLKYRIKHEDGHLFTRTVFIGAFKTMVSYDIEMPLNADILEIEVKFMNSDVFKRTIYKGHSDKTMNVLSVYYTPKNVSVDETVTVSVVHFEKMEAIVIDVATRFGVIEARKVTCNEKKVCKFNLKITEKMLPDCVVNAFFVKDKHKIYHGKVNIVSDFLGGNNLELELSSANVKAKDSVQMTFFSQPNTKIFLLAYDSRLIYQSGSGNEIKHGDVKEKMSEYEKEYFVHTDHLNSWHECSSIELQNVVNGRKGFGKQSSGTRFDVDDDDDFLEEDDEKGWNHKPDDDETIGISGDGGEPILRSDFREVWLFETLLSSSGELKKNFKVPDSITSWRLSAYGFNYRNGLAIMQPQELTVKNEFFLKMNLPYSIRFKETLRLDILVFNYANSRQSLNVKLTLHNLKGKEFRFVEFSKDGMCRESYKNDETKLLTTTIPAGSVKRASFYIQAFPRVDTEDDMGPTKMKLKVTAEASERNNPSVTYKDAVLKVLRVEPMGVKTYEVDVISGQAQTFGKQDVKDPAEFKKSMTKLSRTNVVVVGDFLSKGMTTSSSFYYNPDACLEQSVSNMKRDVMKYLYLSSRGKTMPQSEFAKHYQLVISRKKNDRYSYRNQAGFRAYYIDGLATGAKLGLFSRQGVLNQIRPEFNAISRKISSEGSITDFGSIPSFNAIDNTLKYMQTAYVLSIFLKHKDLLDTSYKSYIDQMLNYINNNFKNYDILENGLSMAAYVNALNGDILQAQGYINRVYNVYNEYSDGKKCLKIKRSDFDCDSLHTIYTALTYAKLQDTTKLMPLIKWIAHQNGFYDSHSYTQYNAFASEAIAESMKILYNDRTDLTITVNDQLDNKKVFNMNDQNNADEQNMEFSCYAGNLTYKISGTGFFSLQFVVELINIAQQKEEKFELSLTTKPYSGTYKILEACGTYRTAYQNKTVLTSVIYEVEFPSGFAFYDVQNRVELFQKVKKLDKRNRGTTIIAYYDQFYADVRYCISIIAKEEFKILNREKTGVKIYDYDDKRSVAIGFYEFSTPLCN